MSKVATDQQGSLHPLMHRHAYPVAGILAVISLPVHAILPLSWSHQLAALLLVSIAGIYIGFAVIDGDRSRLLREALVAVAFMVFAIVAIMVEPAILPLGYIMHGVWDWLHHFPSFTLKMPSWYIPFCAAYDLLAGIGLWFIWSLG